MINLSFSIFLFFCAAANCMNNPHVAQPPRSNNSNLYEAFRNESMLSSSYKNINIHYFIVSGVAMIHRAKTVFRTIGSVIPTGHITVLTERFPERTHFDFPILEVMNISASLPVLARYRLSQMKWMHGLEAARPLLDPPASLDWLVFMDDDTFLIHHALQQLLAAYDPKNSLLVGKFGEPACHPMCGGAGFALSRGLLRKLLTQPLWRELQQYFSRAVGQHNYAAAKNTPPASSSSSSAAALPFHSDVLLSRFVRDHRDKLQQVSTEDGASGGAPVLVGRKEFKNFPPHVAMKWYRPGHRNMAVSFHRIDSPELYQQLFHQYYYSDTSSLPTSSASGTNS